MPRGHSKPSLILSSHFPAPSPAGSRLPAAAQGRPPEASGPAITRTVERFVEAWFQGDTGAMVRCLHPDYVHRLVAIGGRGEPARELLRDAVGVQGQFGSLTDPERRRREVQVLDVRAHSASAVAVLGDWVLQVHLARTGGQWHIVNAMWEMAS